LGGQEYLRTMPRVLLLSAERVLLSDSNLSLYNTFSAVVVLAVMACIMLLGLVLVCVTVRKLPSQWCMTVCNRLFPARTRQLCLYVTYTLLLAKPAPC
jgi:hypothetical protein